MTLIEHKVGNTLWSEIALKLYPDKLSCFREAIANALDEGSEKILVDITSDDIFIEDFGTGIEDMDKFIYVGHDTKLTREEENLIGQKGMGKLSLLALGEKVIFLSNNGEVGYKFDMSVKGHERETPGKPTKFLNHLGTKIVIPFPKFIPNLEKVSTYLTKAFGLYLAQGKQIIVNGKKLAPPKNLNPKPSFICKLKGDHKVVGNITATDKNYGRLDVYIQNVFNSSILIDPTRKFTGWVNCNALEPTASRSDIYEDENGKKTEFLGKMRRFVQKFPKAYDTGPSKNITTEIQKLVEAALKELKIELKGLRLSAIDEKGTDEGSPLSTSHYTETEIEIVKKIHSEKKTTKKQRKKGSGIDFRNASIGDDQPPIFYIHPNIIVSNTTNTLFRSSTNVKNSWGPVKYRTIPYLARALCAIDPEYKNWTPEQYAARADKISRTLLKMAGYDV